MLLFPCKKFRLTCVFSVIFITTSLWLAHPVLPQEDEPAPKRVLALFVFRQGLPWAYRIEESMRAALKERATIPIELNVEHADRERFSEKEYRSRLIDLYRYKYARQKMDMVLAVGDGSADLLLEYGQELFGDIPVVLITAQQKQVSPEKLTPRMTALTWGFDFLNTAKLIRQILPDTRTIYVVSGRSLTDREIKKTAMKELTGKLDGLTLRWLDDFSKEELLSKSSQLPEHSAIYYLTVFRDNKGDSFIPREFLADLSADANVPVFGLVNTYLGYGMVGGYLLSATNQGQRYADIILRVLAGKSLLDQSFMGRDNQPMFDWRELNRWSINANRLPADSVILNREQSIWKDHRGEVVAVILIIGLQALGLVFVIIQHRKRNRAEEIAQRLRDERAHISRLLAMEETAASLAHELNQPLSAVRTYAQAARRFLRSEPLKLDKLDKALAGVITGNRHAEDVIGRIRKALKKEIPQKTHLKAGEMIEAVQVLVRKQAAAANIVLRVKISPQLPPLYGDRIQLQQVLFNLVLNAIEAMSKTPGADRLIVLQAFQETDDLVTISVRDSGKGLDGYEEDRLFDAFYTSKPDGMGIGLAISRSIIEEHKGRLWFSRNPDSGLTFFFTVPVYLKETP